MYMQTYSIVLTNGKIINLIAEEVIWCEKTRTVQFVEDKQTVARINMDNIAGWINSNYAICEIEKEVK